MSELQAAVVDTDVFSHLYVLRSSADPRVPGWRELLTGRRVLISFQTRTEVLAGALANQWGNRRLADLRAVLDQTPTIRADNEVVDAHAKLFAERRRMGHALHDKQRTADRWIAACAISKKGRSARGRRHLRGLPGVVASGVGVTYRRSRSIQAE